MCTYSKTALPITKTTLWELTTRTIRELPVMIFLYWKTRQEKIILAIGMQDIFFSKIPNQNPYNFPPYPLTQSPKNTNLKSDYYFTSWFLMPLFSDFSFNFVATFFPNFFCCFYYMFICTCSSTMMMMLVFHPRSPTTYLFIFPLFHFTLFYVPH